MVYEFPSEGQDDAGPQEAGRPAGARPALHRDPGARRSSCPRPARRASSTTTCSSRTTSTATRPTSSPTRRSSSTTSRENGIPGGRLMLPGSSGELTRTSFEVAHPISDAEIGHIFERPRAVPARVPGPRPADPRGRARSLGGRARRRAARPAGRAQGVVRAADGLRRADLLRDRRAGPARPRFRGDRPRLRRPEGPRLGRRGGDALRLPDGPAARRAARPRARGRLGQLAVPVDALQRRAEGPVQRLPVHLVQVPRPRADPVRRGASTPRRPRPRARSSSTAGRFNGAART